MAGPLKRNRLDGLNPLAYMGVAELSPSDQVFYPRPPTPQDNQNFYVGTWWIDTGTNNPATSEDVWLLVSLQGGVATWINFAGNNALETLTGNDGIAVPGDANDNIFLLGSGGLQVTNTAPNTLTIAPINGNIASQFETDDLLITTPDATGLLNVRSRTAVGGIADNLFSRQGIAANTITYELNPSIIQPNTNASGSQGLYTLGTTDFVSNYAGSGAGGNAFFGGAGNRTLTTASGDTGVGSGALVALTTATNNTAVGIAALQSVTTSLNNVGIGSAAGNKLSTGTGGNVAVGVQALLNSTTATNNTAIGTASIATNITGTDNTAVGNATLSVSTVSQLNAFGSGALQTNSTGTNNCAFGYHSQNIVSTGANNCSFGNLTLAGLTTANGNSAFGHGALAVCTGANNVAVGFGALSANTSGTENVAVGVAALGSNVPGPQNTAVGFNALGSYSGSQNVAIGYNAMANSVNTATTNTAVGTQAMESNDTGDSNTCVGYQSGQALISPATGNTALGDTALSDNSTGIFNTAIGHEAMFQNLTGNYNLAVGNNAGQNWTTNETSNIAIGTIAVAGDNNVLRIGRVSGTWFISYAYIAGIHGVTTDNPAIPVLVAADGQLGTTSSSRKLKENIRPLDIDTSKLYDLEPVSFNYKNRKWQSVGLIAEDVEKIIPQLVVKDDSKEFITVAYNDLPVLLLNEIKKLKIRIDELEAKIKN